MLLPTQAIFVVAKVRVFTRVNKNKKRRFFLKNMTNFLVNKNKRNIHKIKDTDCQWQKDSLIHFAVAR